MVLLVVHILFLKVAAASLANVLKVLSQAETQAFLDIKILHVMLIAIVVLLALIL